MLNLFEELDASCLETWMVFLVSTKDIASETEEELNSPTSTILEEDSKKSSKYIVQLLSSGVWSLQNVVVSCLLVMNALFIELSMQNLDEKNKIFLVCYLVATDETCVRVSYIHSRSFDKYIFLSIKQFMMIKSNI